MVYPGDGHSGPSGYNTHGSLARFLNGPLNTKKERMKNLYKKDCTLCGLLVEVGMGVVHKSEDNWKTYHEECYEKIADRSEPGVKVEHINDEIVFSLVGFHGYRFNSYIQLMRATTYNAETRTNTVSPEKAIHVISALKASSFLLYMSKDVEAFLNAIIDKAYAIPQEVSVRAADDRLRPYQKEGVYWLATHKRALLADDMGLGKTIQILMALPDNRPVTIVCPSSLKYNWMKEAKKWRPDYTPIMLSGRNSYRLPKPGEMIITNYDILPEKIIMDDGTEPVLKNPPGMVVIADEAHKLKGANTKRFESFKQWFATTEYAWLVTATPLLNRPNELWNLLDVIDIAEMTYSSFQNFCNIFNGYRSGWGYNWGKPSPMAGELLKRVTLRRTKDQVAKDIPPKSRVIEEIEFKLDKMATMLCDEAMEAMERDFKTELIFEKIAAARSALAKAKYPALLEMVEEYEDNNEPVVVFSHHKYPLENLAKREGWALITGDTNISKRNEIVEDFQAGNLRGLAATTMAGGVGITLTRACNAIFVDLEWTPKLNEQAEDRLCRIGQTRPVLIKVMEGGHPLDAMVNDIIMRKMEIIDNSVETINNTNSTYRPDISADADSADVITRAKKTVAWVDKKGETHYGEVSYTVKNGTETVIERAPNNAMEEDAWNAILMVNAMDSDCARYENEVGFNKLDGPTARALINNGPFQSNADWNTIVKLANKYRGQNGYDLNSYSTNKVSVGIKLTKKELDAKIEALTMILGSEEAARAKLKEKGFYHKDL